MSHSYAARRSSAVESAVIQPTVSPIASSSGPIHSASRRAR